MMRLSTKGRYAARIMVYLAINAKDGNPARKRDIADAEGITPDYVEQILVKLKAARLVRSHRGARGGFSLAAAPQDITISQILEATEGPTHLVPCLDNHCHRESGCPTRPLWLKAENALKGVFDTNTVADLVRDAEQAARERSLSFEI